MMKSQWQNKLLERSKPLKKLSLKHKLSSSKEKHKFANSLMAVSECSPFTVTFRKGYCFKSLIMNKSVKFCHVARVDWLFS